MNIWRLTVKELKVLSRDMGGLILLFIVPIMFIIIFNYAMGGAFSDPETRPFRVPVVNLDKGELGARVVDELDGSEWIKVERTDENGEQLTEKSAIARVEAGKRNQVIVIPPDFSEKIRAGEEVDIPLYLDPAVPAQYTGPVIGALQGALISATMPEQIRAGIANNDAEIIARIDEMSRQFARERGLPEEGWRSYITPEEIFEKFIRDVDFTGGFEFDEEELLAHIDERQPPSIKREQFPSIYSQTVSAYSVMFVFFIIITIGISFLREKDDGTFRRLLAAPVGRVSILAGKLLPYLIVNYLQVFFMFLTGIVLFNVDLGSSPEGILLTTLCLSVCACGLGILMASLFRTYNQLSSVSVLIVLSTSALAGLMVPRFIMGEFMQQIGLFVPQTWALEAYQDIMVRGGGLLDVLPECGVLLLFAGIFFSVALWRFRFE